MDDVNEIVDRFVGTTATFRSRRWGVITVEAARLTPAADGDLVVHVGRPLAQERPLVRIHSACLFSEVFSSAFCDCASQLNIAMHRLRAERAGLLFYLRWDGRGAGLAAKVAATALELDGVDTYDSRRRIGVEPDGRDFDAVARWLVDNGVGQVRLLTNNPDKGRALENAGIDVEFEPILMADPNDDVADLYRTKAERFGHVIPKELYGRDFVQGQLFVDHDIGA